MRISVVIPAHNEADSIPVLYAELKEVAAAAALSFELIFIDDGSTDATASVLQGIAAADTTVVPIRFGRNFGKAAAYSAGFEAASGEIVCTLDADLQDDPAAIPAMVGALASDVDLVIGKRINRFVGQPTRQFSSFAFNLASSCLFGARISDADSGLRVMTKDVARSLSLRGGSYRFIPFIATARGFQLREIPVTQRIRKYGTSKFGLLRAWGGFIDLVAIRFMLAFQHQPLKFFGALAVGLGLLGTILEGHVIASKLGGDTYREHVAAIVTGGFLIVGALQVAALGLVGEMLADLSGKRLYRCRTLGAPPPQPKGPTTPNGI